MLTPDVRLEGFTTDDWVRLGAVLRRPLPKDAEPPARRGGVVAVTSGARLRKLLHTARGRLRVEDHPWPMPLPELALRHEAAWSLELTARALDDVMDRFAARVTREHDMTQQLQELALAFRAVEQEGGLAAWPRSPASWPLPGERVTQRALDALCPVDRCVVVGVFHAGALHTSLALRRRRAGFDYVLGPDELRHEMGLLSGDWRRDQRHLARAVEQRLGPLGLGCYSTADTLSRLFSEGVPGAWAAAVATRDVLVTPVTPGLAIPLGLDLGWAAFTTLREIVERVGASDWRESPAVQRVRELFGAGGGEDGAPVDLLALLRQLLSRRD